MSKQPGEPSTDRAYWPHFFFIILIDLAMYREVEV